MSAPSKSNLLHDMSAHALHICACRFCPAWRLSLENAQNIVLHFFLTDIDVIRPENLMEFVFVEKTEG